MKTLSLFGVVIAAAEYDSNNFLIDYQNGVIIAPSAMHEAINIQNYMKKNKLSSSQLNNTSFYKSWKKVETVELQDRLRDQVMHYFSTYGLMSLGLNCPEFMYLPADEYATNAPEELKLRVIRGVSKQELIDACLNLLSSGVALKKETIEDILDVLVYCPYIFTGEEIIRNREAKMLIADITGVLPANGDDLFRYLIYKATGETMIIKNKELIDEIKCSSYSLNLNDSQMLELSKSFHRRKELWLAFKFNKNNSAIVNKISKLAKKNHVPVSINVLNSLTSNVFSFADFSTAVKKANVYQIVRALNAVRFYENDTENRYYRVRNGKSFAKIKSSSLNTKVLHQYQKLLIEELKNRTSNQKVYIPDYVDYAIPVSEKMFTGNVPKNTRVFIPYSEKQHLLIGVYWKNPEGCSHSDLDLSAVCLNGKIGWNSHWSTNDKGLMYSGDVTNAIKGASEWMYCKSLQDEYLMTLNSYSCPDNQSYKIIIGYGHKPNSNYMIDPKNILFEVDCEMSQKQKVLGLLKPTDDEKGVEFYLIDQSMGNKIVSSYDEKSKIAQSAVLSQMKSSLRLKDVVNVVNTKENADVILEMSDLAKNSILNLFQ